MRSSISLEVQKENSVHVASRTDEQRDNHDYKEGFTILFSHYYTDINKIRVGFFWLLLDSLTHTQILIYLPLILFHFNTYLILVMIIGLGYKWPASELGDLMLEVCTLSQLKP